MTAKQKKWIIIAVFLSAIIGASYWYFKPKPQQPNYITAVVSRADIENSVMASGKIEAKNQVDVGAQVSGEVTNLYVDVGDEVQKGQVIAQIDPVTQQNTLTTQQANLEQSLANFESSKANYASKQASLETAKSDLVSKQASLKTAKSDLVSKQASLKTAEADLIGKQASLKTAQAELASKQASYQQAVNEHKRLQNLFKNQAVSKQEVEQAETAVKTAQANVESAKNTITTAQANVESAKNAITTAKVAVDNAEDAIVTAQANIENAKNAITSAEANVLTGQSDIVTAQANIKKAQTEVNTAEENLGYTRITAPMAGTVVSITTKQGQTVNANQSAPTIVTLADLKTVRIKAKISEADVITLKAGLPVYFNIIGNPDKKFTATLQAIEPAPEGTTASSSSSSSSSSSAIYYIGYFDVPNEDGHLRIDMTAQVYIIQDKVEKALSVPAAAVKKDPKEGNYVLVVQPDGTTKKQLVKIGLTNRVTTQILSGVTEGQKVVISEESKTNNDSNKNRPPMM